MTPFTTNNTRTIADVTRIADVDWARAIKRTHKAKSQVIITSSSLSATIEARWYRESEREIGRMRKRLSASLPRQRFRRSSQVLISEFREASASFETCHKKATAVTRASIFIYTCIRASFAKNRIFIVLCPRFTHIHIEKERKFPLSSRRHALTRIHTCISLQRRFAFCNSKGLWKGFSG